MGEIEGGPSLAVSVRDREKKYFFGPALSVSSVNDKGPFDILPGHANFISMIKSDLVVRQSPSSTQRITLKGRGVLRVQDDQVEVYFGL